ncbi:MAG: hypothetical protein KGR98_00770 [Verrucomicrobia bacterium]|nr:hypothetical protein [Verrucomicrobiota bacterium]MDE3099360.1 hypothetical protein [Verrucomicrobiota bacterium]
MVTITIKGLSKETHRALKQRAATHRRSLNQEVLSLLDSTVRGAATVEADFEDVFPEARAARAALVLLTKIGRGAHVPRAGRAPRESRRGRGAFGSSVRELK